MNHPSVVSRAEWVSARRILLAREKAAARQRDELARERRQLPMVKVEKEYVFEGPKGPVTLSELFGKHRQLIVYHFMFDPDWEQGCPSCSHCADSFVNSVVHLAARDTALAVVSRAPISRIEPFRQRMGWNFTWVSAGSNDFNYDFHVTLDEAADSTEYNFANALELHKAGKLWSTKGELPGVSVFLREGAAILHTYSTYSRGLDPLLTTYTLLDMTPLGRQDSKDGNPQSWIRHHDRYGI